VKQNLDFFARLSGRKNLGSKEYSAAMQTVGLPEQALKQQVQTFSKGMRQKVGIAIAILKQAPALLLDEPTSGLDPKAAVEFQRLLLRLRDEGKAILMSTHDIFRAKEIADRVGIMKAGTLVMERTAKELEKEDLQKLYLDYMETQPGRPDDVKAGA
jgi:ABC-2 type transport system ATP-binding protein